MENMTAGLDCGGGGGGDGLSLPLQPNCCD